MEPFLFNYVNIDSGGYMKKCSIISKPLKKVSFFQIKDEIALFEYFKRILDFIETNNEFKKNFPGVKAKYFNDCISIEDPVGMDTNTIVVGDWVVLTSLGIFNYPTEAAFKRLWKIEPELVSEDSSTK